MSYNRNTEIDKYECKDFEIASQEISPYLEKDEQIRWAGRSKLDGVIIEPFAVMKLQGPSRYIQLASTLLFVVFILSSPRRHGKPSVLESIFGTALSPVSMVLIPVTAILLIVIAQKLHRMSCAVTNKRVVILKAGQLKSYPLDSISGPEIESRTDGRSDLSFYANIIAGIHIKEGDRQKYTLLDVLYGDNAYALLCDAVYSKDMML